MPDASASAVPVLWQTDRLLAARRTLPGRPERFEGLLLEPIVDRGEPPEAGENSYKDWDKHHAVQRRFYIAGLQWFLDTFRAMQITFDSHRKNAHTRVLNLTTWHTMRDPSGFWKKPLGRPQVLYMFQGEAVPFAKAAQLLMTCEIIVEELLEERDSDPKAFAEREIVFPEDVTKPEHIHRYMGILSACWNIDAFNEEFVRKVRITKMVDPHSELADGLGLRSPYAVAELTRGNTVTRIVAHEIHKLVATNYANPDLPIGKVRAQPGKKKLGRKGATTHEAPELL